MDRQEIAVIDFDGNQTNVIYPKLVQALLKYYEVSEVSDIQVGKEQLDIAVTVKELGLRRTSPGWIGEDDFSHLSLSEVINA